jgi:hypothetical protein
LAGTVAKLLSVDFLSFFSLASTILFYRPDLEPLIGYIGFTVASSYQPVMLNPPPMFFSCMSFYFGLHLYNILDYRIPGIGELMLASFISTVSNLTPTLFDHTYWYLKWVNHLGLILIL